MGFLSQIWDDAVHCEQFFRGGKYKAVWRLSDWSSYGNHGRQCTSFDLKDLYLGPSSDKYWIEAIGEFRVHGIKDGKYWIEIHRCHNPVRRRRRSMAIGAVAAVTAVVLAF